MAFWQIEFSKQAYKYYKTLQKGYQKKINKILNLLMDKEKNRHKAHRRRNRYL